MSEARQMDLSVIGVSLGGLSVLIAAANNHAQGVIPDIALHESVERLT